MSHHTEGKLTLHRAGQSVGAADGTGVCEVWPRDEEGFPDSEGMANARRIVACWNFCHGIATDDMKDVSLEEYVVTQAFMSGMSPDEAGGANIKMNGLACQMMAAAFAGQFKGAGGTNYVEFNFNHEETGPMTITMQRQAGRTPAQLRIDAERQRDELLAALESLNYSASADSRNAKIVRAAITKAKEAS